MWLLIDWGINFERDGDEVRGVCQRMFREEEKKRKNMPDLRPMPVSPCSLSDWPSISVWSLTYTSTWKVTDVSLISGQIRRANEEREEEEEVGEV